MSGVDALRKQPASEQLWHLGESWHTTRPPSPPKTAGIAHEQKNLHICEFLPDTIQQSKLSFKLKSRSKPLAALTFFIRNTEDGNTGPPPSPSPTHSTGHLSAAGPWWAWALSVNLEAPHTEGHNALFIITVIKKNSDSQCQLEGEDYKFF